MEMYELKRKVLEMAGFVFDDGDELGTMISRLEESEELTECRCRNGHDVIWYRGTDGNEVCYDMDADTFLSEDEISEELAEYR